MLKKRYLILFLTAAVAGALLFGWGYHHGATSVEIRDSVIVRYRPGRVVRDTIREPYPVIVREPPDTICIPADTAAILADYLRERDYPLDFSTDSTGRFLVTATVGRNRLLSAEATIEPLIREVIDYRTVIRDVRQVPRWRIDLDAGVNLRNQWAGVSATRNFGWFSLSGTAGYDPFRREPVLEIRGKVAIWQSFTKK